METRSLVRVVWWFKWNSNPSLIEECASKFLDFQ
jgi:hypothetical protein